jgi:hypothetical protein
VHDPDYLFKKISQDMLLRFTQLFLEKMCSRWRGGVFEQRKPLLNKQSVALTVLSCELHVQDVVLSTFAALEYKLMLQ